MKRPARWWIVFALCNVVVAAALLWMTAVVVELERAELRARADAEHQESVRAAMWRMDSWLSVFLAREAARPVVEYRPFVVQQTGSGGVPDAALTPSPLRDFRSEYSLLHVEVDPRGGVTSPQAPRVPVAGTDRTQRESVRAVEMLERLRPYLDLETIRARAARAESMATTKLAGVVYESATDGRTLEATQAVKSQNEFNARINCAVPPPPGSDNVGRLIPMWLDAPGADAEPALAFLRWVQAGGQERFQGFIGDWPRLRERLLLEIRDLFPHAELLRVRADSPPVDPLGRYLANIPAALVTPSPVLAVTEPRLTPTRAALGLAWLATIVAALAVGATLKKSIHLGERRQRFVSAVTHELRTPLTTFRLYTEMLNSGVVRDSGQRRQYLATLQDESERLASLVENVLAHARLEEGRAPRRCEPMTLDQLLARVAPPLERRAALARMSLRIATASPGDVPLEVDAETIGQVLLNLVDNAGKYATNGARAPVDLTAAVDGDSLTIRVRDRGPGVPPEHARSIFEAFERGGRDPADPVPGLGLGLALSRGLARDMGGDLTLEGTTERGACFRLDVPIAARPA